MKTIVIIHQWSGGLKGDFETKSPRAHFLKKLLIFKF